ncbi:putative zinc binding protein [Jatrophihabitans sp. GAS493]|nr:putative zinc binding protein [Jatrophihabitans sp. GAS493]
MGIVAQCRWCSERLDEVVLDLGRQPAADDFPLLSDSAQTEVFPLQMAVCGRCGLAQLVEDLTVADEPRGIEPEALIQQANQAIVMVAASGLLGAGTRVVEFDSPHGGSWRPRLVERGVVDLTDADEADAQGEPADLVIDVFSLMHDADQRKALAARVDRLAPEGTLLLQFHPLTTIVDLGQWNALRHGHMAYYSVTALVGMLAEFGLTPATAWAFPLYGTTLLLSFRRGAEPDASVRRLLEADRRCRATDPAYAASLQDDLSRTTSELRTWLVAAQAAGLKVAGYAAASRAVPLLNAAQIGPDLISFVADSAPAKAGRVIPGVGIEVVGVQRLVESGADRVLLFVPDLLDEVRRDIPAIEASGGRWVLAEPSPREVAVEPTGSGSSAAVA